MDNSIYILLLFEQHCKEKGDWAKLGTLYVNVRSGCENFGDLEKYSLCIANILTDSVTEERPGVPFCEFAVAGKICTILPIILESHAKGTLRKVRGISPKYHFSKYYHPPSPLPSVAPSQIFHRQTNPMRF